MDQGGAGGEVIVLAAIQWMKKSITPKIIREPVRTELCLAGKSPIIGTSSKGHISRKLQ